MSKIRIEQREGPGENEVGYVAFYNGEITGSSYDLDGARIALCARVLRDVILDHNDRGLTQATVNRVEEILVLL